MQEAGEGAFERARRTLWRRKWVLLIAALLAAGAALPLALAGPTLFSSATRVIVPSAPPLPKLNELIRPSVLAIQLGEYIEGGLEEDVREELGEDADHLESIVAVQDPDLFSYRLTASARQSEVAVGAAETAAQILIDKADEISNELVAKLDEQIEAALEPIREKQFRLQAKRAEKTPSLRFLRSHNRTLTRRLTRVEDALERLRNAEVEHPVAIESLETRLAEVEDSVGAIAPDLEEAQREVEDLSLEISILQKKRTGLLSLAQEAEEARLARFVASAVVSEPSTPEAETITRTVGTVLASVAVGLAVAAGILLLLEGRRRKRAS